MTITALLLALLAIPGAAPNAPTGPRLLDFHADWCGPCQQMRPAIRRLVEKGYPIQSVDTGEQPELAEKYDVSQVPTFIVVDAKGRALARSQGAQPAGELAALYNQAVARASQTSDVPDRRPVDGPSADTPSDLPKPWETVVRIRIPDPRGRVGFGSGTIIASNDDEAIILTCAHIFHIEGARTQPSPKAFPLKIFVDQFDGQPGGPKGNQVSYETSFAGTAIDYDHTTDVGLIRIRPGRRLPASPVVPPSWRPKKGMMMTAVGCSEGHDATACTTYITDPGLPGSTFGKPSYQGIQCDFRPKLGRSGGGLYTLDGFVAGVCDFAEVRSNHGLYAAPQSIHRLLDRNRLTALYQPPPSNKPGTLLASNTKPTRPRAETPKLRAQSHGDNDPPTIPLPSPDLVIRVPSPAPTDARVGKGRANWQAPGDGSSGAIAASRSQTRRPSTEDAVAVDLKRDSSPLDDLGEPEAVESANQEGPAPSKAGSTSGAWRPARSASR